MDPIDLDHNATSPLDPDVFEAMRPHWFAGGNAESRHSAGRAARRALIESTETVARVLNAHTDEIVFTSGGTEANNMAIFGLASETRGCAVASTIEHPAVMRPLAWIRVGGRYDVDLVETTSEGLVDLETMRPYLEYPATFATLMLAQNETGAIQPVARLAAMAGERGIPVHTDAAQAVGRIPVDFRGLGVATLAASAHKFGGPVGVGLLLVRRGMKIDSILAGGGQQNGRRPGTVPVPLIVGLAAALEKWDREVDARVARWTRLRDRLESTLIAALGPDRAIRNGPIDPAKRLPQTLNIGFPGLDGDLILMKLDQAGVHASLGSACASGTTEPSHVLRAMGVPEDRVRSSVRFSLGPATTEAQVDEAAWRIISAVGID